MGRRVLMVSVFVFALLSGCQYTVDTPSSEPILVKVDSFTSGNWNAGLDWSASAFTKVVPNDGKNAVFSPYAGFQFWAIAINGSEDKVQNAMLGRLSGSPSLEELNCSPMQANIRLRQDPSLSLASALWCDPYVPNHTLETQLKEVFASEIGEMPSNDGLDAWTKKVSKGQQSKSPIYPMGPTPRAIFASALSLNAKWLDTMVETKGWTFMNGSKSVRVTRLLAKGNYPSWTTSDYVSVSLPFEHYNQMVLILPRNRESDPYSVLKNITNDEWRDFAYKDKSEDEQEVTFPAFRMEKQIDLLPYLNETLKETGQDWKFIGGDGGLIQAVQQLNITADKYGTKAAAVTMGEVAKGTSQVRFNRPFAFALMKKDNPLPLFVGLVYDPSTIN